MNEGIAAVERGVEGNTAGPSKSGSGLELGGEGGSGGLGGREREVPSAANETTNTIGGAAAENASAMHAQTPIEQDALAIQSQTSPELPPAEDGVQPSTTVMESGNETVVGRRRRRQVRLHVCDCGEEVAQDDPSRLAVSCKKKGCETVWVSGSPVFTVLYTLTLISVPQGVR